MSETQTIPVYPCNFKNRGKEIGRGSFNTVYEYKNDPNHILVDKIHEHDENDKFLRYEYQNTLQQHNNVIEVYENDEIIQPYINKCEIENEEDKLCISQSLYHTIFTCPKMGMTFYVVIATFLFHQNETVAYIIVLYIVLMQMIRLLNERNLVHGDPTLSNIMFGKDVKIENITSCIENTGLFRWISTMTQDIENIRYSEQELKNLFVTFRNDIVRIITMLQIKWIDLDTLTRLENPTNYDRMIDLAIAYQSMYNMSFTDNNNTYYLFPNVTLLIADIMTIQMFALDGVNQDEEYILYILGLGHFYDGFKDLEFNHDNTRTQYLGYFRNHLLHSHKETLKESIKEQIKRFDTYRETARRGHAALKDRKDITAQTKKGNKLELQRKLQMTFPFKNRNPLISQKRANSGDPKTQTKPKTEQKGEWSSSEDESDDLLAKETLQ